MSDLISRSRLIEEIKENQWGWFSREMLLLILENQPSVTDTNVGCKWIPCSERLPEHAGKYLVTTDGTFGIDVIDIARFENNEWHKSSKIIAWMPLPEPYKGE